MLLSACANKAPKCNFRQTTVTSVNLRSYIHHRAINLPANWLKLMSPC